MCQVNRADAGDMKSHVMSEAASLAAALSSSSSTFTLRRLGFALGHDQTATRAVSREITLSSRANAACGSPTSRSLGVI
jgi:hypothetical protein